MKFKNPFERKPVAAEQVAGDAEKGKGEVKEDAEEAGGIESVSGEDSVDVPAAEQVIGDTEKDFESLRESVEQMTAEFGEVLEGEGGPEAIEGFIEQESGKIKEKTEALEQDAIYLEQLENIVETNLEDKLLGDDDYKALTQRVEELKEKISHEWEKMKKDLDFVVFGLIAPFSLIPTAKWAFANSSSTAGFITRLVTPFVIATVLTQLPISLENLKNTRLEGEINAYEKAKVGRESNLREQLTEEQNGKLERYRS